MIIECPEFQKQFTGYSQAVHLFRLGFKPDSPVKWKFNRNIMEFEFVFNDNPINENNMSVMSGDQLWGMFPYSIPFECLVIDRRENEAGGFDYNPYYSAADTEVNTRFHIPFFSSPYLAFALSDLLIHHLRHKLFSDDILISNFNIAI